MKIVDLDLKDQLMVAQAAQVLVDAFSKHYPNAWNKLEDALEELAKFVGDERICRVALNEDDQVIGWIGAIDEYDGHAWELHPLAVAPSHHGQGVGRLLVQDLEKQLQAVGACTVYLGTDDEDSQTSLSQVDPYPNPLKHLGAIQNINHHPFEFYLKQGFSITGMIPDANGPGKPDILMAKRIQQRSALAQIP